MFLRHLTGFRFHLRKYNRTLNTNLCEINSRNPGRYPVVHIIVTLDPNKFAEKKQQRLNIGNLKTFKPCILLHDHSDPVMDKIIHYDRTSKENICYPPDTKAFLYYFTSPEKPRIAGELRLRVASGDDPASFENGSDLLRTNGRTWSRPLHVLSKHYIPLYEILKKDRLISDDLDKVLSTFPSSKIPRYRRSQLLYTLNDTFIVDFSKNSLYLFFITEQGAERLPIFFLFSDYRGRYDKQGPPPYTGSALARFERSTLPDHKGTRTVVLRFLKIITPVKCVVPDYDGYICCPKEGELYRKDRYNKSLTLDSPVWSINIDKPKGRAKGIVRGLRLLWDI